MARAALRWKVSDLSAMTGVHANTISAIEDGRADPRASTLASIIQAYEGAGIRFTEYGVEYPPPRKYGPGTALLLGETEEAQALRQRAWDAATGKAPKS